MPALQGDMYAVVFTLLGTAMLVPSAPVTGSCPKLCECLVLDGEKTVNCERLHFVAIPFGFPNDTVKIMFKKNDIVELSATHTFPLLPVLRTLKMDSGELRKLGPGAFKNLPALETLTLSSNKIETLDSAAFRGATKLSHLDMRMNNIEELPHSAFNGLHLKRLLLNTNKINVLNEGTFVEANIFTLNISGNALSRIPSGILQPLKGALKTFTLEDNQKALAFDKTVFTGFNLTVLSVVGSQVTDLAFLEYLTTEQLDLSNNQFSVSSLDFRRYSLLRTLSKFSLTHSSIDKCPPEMFSNFAGLKELDLSWNKLTRLPAGLAQASPHLENLRVDYNRLRSMSVEELQPYVDIGLNTLSFQGNKLQYIDPAIGPLLARITFVETAGNPWHCNCQMRWYREWLPTKPSVGHGDACFTPEFSYMLHLYPKDFVCTPPTFAGVTGNVTLSEGEDLFLSCAAKSDPAPEVKWVAPSGESITVAPSSNRTHYRTTAMWSLKGVRRGQSGWYTCSASNLEGNVTRTVCVCVGASTGGDGTCCSKGKDTTTTGTTTTPTTTTPTTTTLTTTTTTPTTTSTTIMIPTTTNTPTTIQPLSTTATQDTMTTVIIKPTSQQPTMTPHATTTAPVLVLTTATPTRVITTTTSQTITSQTNAATPITSSAANTQPPMTTNATYVAQTTTIKQTSRDPDPAVQHKSADGGTIAMAVMFAPCLHTYGHCLGVRLSATAEAARPVPNTRHYLEFSQPTLQR
ncbi:hypothetical protein LSAT2_002220 [Lamellibrachia satsuma]|nr:hypothetical protein LSAT2_002220 [Lamellibrachia satsuma]